MSFQAGQVGLIRGQAATGRDDSFVAARQFFDDSALPFAEGGFAVVLENLLNRCARSRFDNVIGVQEREMQRIGDKPACMEALEPDGDGALTLFAAAPDAKAPMPARAELESTCRASAAAAAPGAPAPSR